MNDGGHIHGVIEVDQAGLIESVKDELVRKVVQIDRLQQELIESRKKAAGKQKDLETTALSLQTVIALKNRKVRSLEKEIEKYKIEIDANSKNMAVKDAKIRDLETKLQQQSMGGGGGHSMRLFPRERPAIQRNSMDLGKIWERPSMTTVPSAFDTPRAPIRGASMSSVTATDRLPFGERPRKWSTVPDGRIGYNMPEDRAAVIQQTSRFMQHRSSYAPIHAYSEDEREQNERREKQEADLTKRIVCDVGDYGTGEIKLEEVRDEIFKCVGAEKFGKPSVQTVFKYFMAASLKKVIREPGMGPKFGHVLSFCLLKKTEERDSFGRVAILKGIADSCREVVEQEQWEDAPKIWDIFAEVLINAHMPKEDLYEGAHPTLADFKDAFLHAAKDTRKPYTLFVLVLKRLAEFHHNRDQDSMMEVMSWVMGECDSIVKKLVWKKLNKALEETTTNFGENLHKIMYQ